MYEEYAYVLDFAQDGKSKIIRERQGPIVQAVGESNFAFLEILVAPCRSFFRGERLRIGKKNREHVVSVLGKLDPEELTKIAKMSLTDVAWQLVAANRSRFERMMRQEYFPRNKMDIQERDAPFDPRKFARRLAAELLREQDGKLFLLAKDGWNRRPRVVGKAAAYAKALGGGPVGNSHYLGGSSP